ncbi:hypothetical protein AB0J52_37865 [Spirillospora sp. NPDC049652]
MPTDRSDQTRDPRRTDAPGRQPMSEPVTQPQDRVVAGHADRGQAGTREGSDTGEHKLPGTEAAGNTQAGNVQGGNAQAGNAAAREMPAGQAPVSHAAGGQATAGHAAPGHASAGQVAGGQVPGGEAGTHVGGVGSGARAAGNGATAAGGTTDTLLPLEAASRFRDRWHELQSGFVDDPDGSVRKADELTTEVVAAIGQALTARKHELDGRARDGKQEMSDTERLRQALRGYRDLVDRMLGA